MKKIAILGSTGSIGTNVLKVIQNNPGTYEVVALSAGKNTNLLSEQIKIFRPQVVAVLEEKAVQSLQQTIPGGQGIKVLFGIEGFQKIAALPQVDVVVSAMTGAAGLLPTYAAVREGKDVALANKETLVMAGPLIMAEVQRSGVTLLPIDSEHSAILQSMRGHEKEDLDRVILTASGGPFRERTLEEMSQITPEQALRHPNWEMGNKITIDSATLMNKGLEVIEARWLFDLSMRQIEVLVHPESILHSMVVYKDGSMIGQMGVPDMTIPISYALFYPRHRPNGLSPLSLDEIGALTFQKPDLTRFPCLALALKASETGESMPAVLNAANEVAVNAFLHGKIQFLRIPQVIEKTMETHTVHPVQTIEAVMAADAWARQTAMSLLNNQT